MRGKENLSILIEMSENGELNFTVNGSPVAIRPSKAKPKLARVSTEKTLRKNVKNKGCVCSDCKKKPARSKGMCKSCYQVRYYAAHRSEQQARCKAYYVHATYTVPTSEITEWFGMSNQAACALAKRHADAPAKKIGRQWFWKQFSVVSRWLKKHTKSPYAC